MSEESLTNEEVDALLEGVSGSDADSADAHAEVRLRGDAEGAPEVRSYKLGAEPNASQLKLPMLEVINDRVARELKALLSELLDREVEVKAKPLAVCSYREFVDGLTQPSNLNLLDVVSLQGPAMMVCEPSLLFSVIDTLFGGSGRFQVDLQGREFSGTETRVINRLVQLFIQACASGWSSVHELNIVHRRSEMSTRFGAIAEEHDAVVSIDFDVRFGESGGRFLLCLPATTLEPVREMLGAPVQGEVRAVDRQWQERLSRQIQSAEVTISADLAHATATIGELLKLKAGDFIELDLKPTVIASIDQVPVFECRYGLSNHRYSIRIQSFLTTRDDLLSGDPHVHR